MNEHRDERGNRPDPKTAQYRRLADIPLLSSKEENETARRLALAERSLRETVLASPAGVRALLAWADATARGRLAPKRLLSHGSKNEAGEAALRRKLKNAAVSVSKDLRRLQKDRARLRRENLSAGARLKLQAAMDRRRAAMYLRITALPLSDEAVGELADGIRRDPRQKALGRIIDSLRSASAKHRDLLVRSNLRLVIAIAKRYAHTGFELSDLVQEGSLGLMKMADKFDPSRGCRFSTYATWWIRQAIQRSVAEKGRTIRVPVHVVDLLSRVAKAGAALREKTGREPSVAELAKRLRVRIKKIETALALLQEPVSLSASHGEDGAVDLTAKLEDKEQPAPDDGVFAEFRRGAVKDALSRLSAREAQVLRLRFGLGSPRTFTLRQLGRRLRVSRERVRQIEHEAIAKLRDPSLGRSLADYYLYR